MQCSRPYISWHTSLLTLFSFIGPICTSQMITREFASLCRNAAFVQKGALLLNITNRANHWPTQNNDTGLKTRKCFIHIFLIFFTHRYTDPVHLLWTIINYVIISEMLFERLCFIWRVLNESSGASSPKCGQQDKSVHFYQSMIIIRMCSSYALLVNGVLITLKLL